MTTQRDESAYLNADQETKLNLLVNEAEAKLGRAFKNKKLGTLSKSPANQLGTIRIVIEALPARDALVEFIENLKNPAPDQAEISRLERIVEDFDEDVLAHELEQIKNGKQIFVAEKDEATQE